MQTNFSNRFTKLIVFLFFIVFFIGCSSKTDHSDKIKEAITEMKASAAKLGVPNLVNDTLSFGTTIINNNFQIIDALHAKYGCSATFFIKKGSDFIRISTDIIQDSHRAIGTQLDPNGPVIIAIRKGEPFYGTVDILGNKYETGYEPIKNANNEVIGIYYVGFQINEKK